jgi:Flp pilus assembly pilin Flp
MKIHERRAQALTDYALILALVALLILAVLTLLGSQVAEGVRKVLDGLNGQATANLQTIARDFM